MTTLTTIDQLESHLYTHALRLMDRCPTSWRDEIQQNIDVATDADDEWVAVRVRGESLRFHSVKVEEMDGRKAVTFRGEVR